MIPPRSGKLLLIPKERRLANTPLYAFVPYSGNEFTRTTVEHIRRSGIVEKIFLLAVTSETNIAGCQTLEVDSVASSRTIKLMLKNAPRRTRQLKIKCRSSRVRPSRITRRIQFRTSPGAAFPLTDSAAHLNRAIKGCPKEGSPHRFASACCSAWRT